MLVANVPEGIVATVTVSVSLDYLETQLFLTKPRFAGLPHPDRRKDAQEVVSREEAGGSGNARIHLYYLQVSQFIVSGVSSFFQ